MTSNPTGQDYWLHFDAFTGGNKYDFTSANPEIGTVNLLNKDFQFYPVILADSNWPILHHSQEATDWSKNNPVLPKTEMVTQRLKVLMQMTKNYIQTLSQRSLMEREDTGVVPSERHSTWRKVMMVLRLKQ